MVMLMHMCLCAVHVFLATLVLDSALNGLSSSNDIPAICLMFIVGFRPSFGAGALQCCHGNHTLSDASKTLLVHSNSLPLLTECFPILYAD